MKRKKTKMMVGPVALVITVIIVAAFFVAGNFVINKHAKNQRSNDTYIKGQVEMAIGMLDQINKKREQGFYTLTQAKQMGADMLRNLRYGDDKQGYFWADTSKGVNVVLLGDKKVEGTNRLNAELNGMPYVKMIIQNGMMPNGGFTDYYYYKMGGILPCAKRAYSMYYKPFDWVVGTGYYPQTVK